MKVYFLLFKQNSRVSYKNIAWMRDKRTPKDVCGEANKNIH